MALTDQEIKEMYSPSYDRNNPKFEEFKNRSSDCFWPNRFGITYEMMGDKAVEICGGGEERKEKTIADALQSIRIILDMQFERTDLVPNYELTSLKWWGDEICRETCSPQGYQDQVRWRRISNISRGAMKKVRSKNELRRIGKEIDVAEIYVYRYISDWHFLRAENIACVGVIDSVYIPEEFNCQYVALNEKEYQDHICAGTCQAADFDKWFDDKNANVLIVTIEDD